MRAVHSLPIFAKADSLHHNCLNVFAIQAILEHNPFSSSNTISIEHCCVYFASVCGVRRQNFWIECNLSQSQQDFKFSTIELQSLGIRQNHLESARIVLGLKVSYNPTVIDGIAVCTMSQLGRLGLQFCLMASHRRRLGAISTQSNSIGLNCSRVVDFPQLSHNPVDCKK